MTRVPRGEARQRLLAAATDLIRRQGFAATSVDDLCAAAGVTKGAFFHHFPSKDALGAAVVELWTETTSALFASHPYNTLPDPLDRVFAYIDLRRSLADRPIPEFSCVAGTTVQETYHTHPAIRAAAEASIRSGAAHIHAHLAEALVRHPVPGVTAESLALYLQVIVQGGIITAKALDDAAAMRDALDHADRYLRLLFARPKAA